jgi:hypothetical protein
MRSMSWLNQSEPSLSSYRVFYYRVDLKLALTLTQEWACLEKPDKKVETFG